MEIDEQAMEQSFKRLIQEQEELGATNYGAFVKNELDGEKQSHNGSQSPSRRASPKKTSGVEEIKLDVLNRMNPVEERTTLVRRQTKSVKEASKGIEDILQEMPSRTVGRKRGAKMISGTITGNRFGSVYRHQRMASINDDVDANELYKEISAENGDVDNNELRELAVNMTLKRQVRSQAKRLAEGFQGHSVRSFSLWKYKMAMKWRHAKDDFRKFISSLNLWNHHLKQVEGYFGTGVLSYFTFLRGIFLLSVPSFLLSFVFISIPQLFDLPEKPVCYFTGEEFLTGANCLTDTIMYQGYYTNTSINKIGNTYYNMPLAYLLATFGYFLLCLIWLAKTTAVLFRENYIDAKEDGSNFINKVFCSWDFGTTSQTTALIQHKTITTDLKEILAEQKREADHRTACEKFEVFLMRVVSWGFYFSLVAGSVALIYFTNKTFICEIKSKTEATPILQVLALPLIVSMINLFCPYFITLITHLEKYKYRRHELYISVLRNFLFKMSLLAVICAFWTSNDLQSCSQNLNETSSCWETDLGQEIYRLIIVDFIFSMIFSTFCAEFLRNILSKIIGKKGPEFSISNNVLDLIYGQTLCWIGVYFSPLLALINIIKYFLLFYVKKISVMNNCRPSTKHWRASQSQTLFNSVQLVSFILSTAFLCYVIFNETPSPDCGPFRGKNRAYDIVVDEVSDLAETTSGNWFAFLLNVVTSVWVLNAVVIAILIAVIFARSKARGLYVLAGTLEEQIALEGKDKTLLLRWLQNMSQRQNIRGSAGANLPGTSSGYGSKDAGSVLLSAAVISDDDLDLITDEDTVFKPS